MPIVESSWGTPERWGRPATEHTALTLDLRAYTARLTGHSLEVGQIGLNGIAAICLPANTSPCELGNATMVVQLAPPRLSTQDTATVHLLMYRDDFSSEWALTLVRQTGVWVVAGKRMLSIT